MCLLSATAAHPCGMLGPEDADATIPSGKRGIGYNAKKGLYTLTWTSDKTWKGTCRTLVLKLADGTVHHAEFSFK